MIGEIELRLHISQNSVVSHMFKVTNQKMELILGADFLTKFGVVLNFYHGCAHFLGTSNKPKIHMMRLSEWRSESTLSHVDFTPQITPDRYKKIYPNLNLREIADKLERTEAKDDITPEMGKAYIRQIKPAVYTTSAENKFHTV